MNNKFKVKVAPMSKLNDEAIPWTEIWSTPWPLPLHMEQPREQNVREEVTTLTIPSEHRTEPFAMHIEVSASSGDWKAGWWFEGIGITKSQA